MDTRVSMSIVTRTLGKRWSVAMVVRPIDIAKARACAGIYTERDHRIVLLTLISTTAR